MTSLRDSLATADTSAEVAAVLDAYAVAVDADKLSKSALSAELAALGAGGIPVYHFSDLAALNLPLGAIVYVDDLAPELVEFTHTPFGNKWRPTRKFAFQGMSAAYYTFDNTTNDYHYPWVVSLPAGILSLGWIEVMFACDYTAATAQKLITVGMRDVADTAKFFNAYNKTIASADNTHEAPRVVIATRDSSYFVSPYAPDNDYSSDSSIAFAAQQGLAVDPENNDCFLYLRTRFNYAGSGSTFNVRFVRAIFHPF